MATTPEQDALLRRIHALVADDDVREVSMFGSRAIMLNDKMIVSVCKDGSLLVRVAAANHDELLAEPGATQAEMGAGRSMGPGWLHVAPTSIADDERLTFWVDVAKAHNRTLTGEQH